MEKHPGAGFLALDHPTHRAFPAQASGIAAVFVTITVAGRRELHTPFPYPKAQKNPRT
jgi:hypothetical protein